jgi:hypothetical protein
MVDKIKSTILSVGKMQFFGKVMTGGWMRWFPANDEAITLLSSFNKRVPYQERKDYFREDVVRSLCETNGLPYTGRMKKEKVKDPSN